MWGFLRRLFGIQPPGRVATVMVGNAVRARLVARDRLGGALLRYRVRVEDAADGEYRVEAVLPTPGRALRLRARNGGAALLVQGDSASRPTDGSVCMADAELAELLRLLPDDPGMVVFRIRTLPDTDAADGDAADGDGADGDTWTSDGDRDRRPDVPVAIPDAQLDTAGDQAVAAALADLGYDVRPDRNSAAEPPTADPSTDWTPAGGAYGP